MLAIEDTIISQYADSPILTRLIYNMQTYIDPTANLDAFYNLMWNISTAQGFGLDNWGVILGVTRVLQISAGVYFGFEEATDANGWNQQAFYAGAPITSNYALGDPSYRTLLLAKAAFNITDCSIPSINALLLSLFPGLGGYCTDGEDFTMTYTFTAAPDDVQLAIISQSGAIPKPTGVSFTVVHP